MGVVNGLMEELKPCPILSAKWEFPKIGKGGTFMGGVPMMRGRVRHWRRSQISVYLT